MGNPSNQSTMPHASSRMRECLRNIFACLGIFYVMDILLSFRPPSCHPDHHQGSSSLTIVQSKMFPQQQSLFVDFELPDPSHDTTTTDWNAISCSDAVHDCDLTDTKWGIPTILLSFGRSGSTVTWDTLAELSAAASHRNNDIDNNGMTTNALWFQPSTEDLGKSMQATVKFFDAIPAHEHGKCALERILCARQAENKQRLQQQQQQHENPTTAVRPGIFGTKWKPYLESFGHVKARQTLQWLAMMQPHVKIIYNQRNLLDVYLSKYKHEATHVPAHCHQGNVACVQQHQAAEQSLVVPTETLIDELAHWEHATNQTLALLQAYHVPILQVQYEKLYYSNDANAQEWNRLWKYMWGDDATPMTQDDVMAHLHHVATSAASHADKMSNYLQVQDVLRGTRFVKYLQ